MTSPESPAGARRRVRLAVRTAREALGLTQFQVAEAMEWSQSKVIRIESGEVTVSPNDLRPLLAFLEITDKTIVDRLVRDARSSRQRKSWWDEPRIRDHLTEASRQLIQFELEAVEVRHFLNITFPGQLQTDAYARAVLSGFPQLSEEQIAVRLETRQRRRDELLARRDFPRTYMLLEESVLKRHIGDATTTAEQLREILRISREKPLWIRVLHYGSNAPLPVIGQFDILKLTGDGANSVLYRESYLTDEVVEDASNIQRHREMFEISWDAALDEGASAALVEEAAKALSAVGPPPETPETRRVSPGTASAPTRTRRPRR
jgi:transcriptional regulator with XRE-family HTH domain